MSLVMLEVKKNTFFEELGLEAAEEERELSETERFTKPNLSGY